MNNLNPKLNSFFLLFFFVLSSISYSFSQTNGQEFETQVVSLNFFDSHNEVKVEEYRGTTEVVNLQLINPQTSNSNTIAGFITGNVPSFTSALVGFFILIGIIYFIIIRRN